ncbi:hypothetical protein AAFP30_03015 [Gordonia sp. CPCC 205515]|uniref:hypothetical protein n=1 Tax=Gordonia sp. CPCC 205515 TaxID=3140791 RepID=UPI003AF3BCBA
MSTTAGSSVPMRTVLSHIAVPLLMGAVMALAYLGGFHKPDPHDLRIDIVGSTTQTAVVTDQLQRALGDHADLRVVDTVDQARDALLHREIAGAYVLSDSHPTLMVSTGASDTAAVSIERMFMPVAAHAGLPLDITDVAPVDSGTDPSGQSLFFFLVALTVGAYATAIAIGAAGASKPLSIRIGLGVIGAAVNTALVTFIGTVIFDAIGSHTGQIMALAFVYCLAIMAFGIALHSLIGRFTTIVMVTLFVGLNFTSSGGVFPPSLQPGFFGALHSFWIGAGFNEAGRNLLYFPSVGITGEVWKIVGWVIVGAALLGTAAAVERRRAANTLPAAPAGRHERGGLTETTEEELEEAVVA